MRLAGLAGLIGGAFSMAAGEYVSMRAQSELFERELAVEREAIRAEPEGERTELALIYRDRGIRPQLADALSTEMMRDPELALQTHAREELGIDPEQTGNPLQAAVSSFLTFAVGALVPLLPWLFVQGTTAILWSVSLGAVASLAVGAALSLFTGRSWWWSATRQLFVATAAAGVTTLIGHAVGHGG